MQGTRVESLVREDATCLGADKPVYHNYRACALEPTLGKKRSHCNEKLPPIATKESPHTTVKTQCSQKHTQKNN